MMNYFSALIKNRIYLITGSTGFIGSFVANELSKNKARLILVDESMKKLLSQKKNFQKIIRI